MTWWLPKDDTTKTVGRTFFTKLQYPWEDQLMLYEMKTLMQFANGLKKKKFTLS